MVVFGLTSSVFDFITFGVLYLVLHLSGAPFQTGWFIESLATQTLVIYIIRTKKIPFLQSRPSWQVLVSTLAVIVVGFLLVTKSVGEVFDFKILSSGTILAIGLIVAAYLVTVFYAKQWFYRRLAGE